MSVRTCFILWLFLLSLTYSFSQKPEWEPSYTNISVADGLPSSETYYVHQDRSGNLWFCSDHGVVRYDGYRLYVYDESNGLPDEVVFKIYEDYKGRVWFYLYNGKLAYYDPQKKKVLPYKYNYLLHQLNHGDFNNQKLFSVGKNDQVYYSGVYGAGRIDKNGKLFRYKSRPLKVFLEVGDNWLITRSNDTIDKYGNQLRIIPENGKVISVIQEEEIIRYDFVRINQKRFVSINNVVLDVANPSNKIAVTGFTGFCKMKGELWITTLTGAYRFKNPEKANLSKPDGVYLKDQKVTAVAKDTEGGYWFSTLDKGIFYTPSLEIVHWIPEEKKSQGTILDLNGIGDQVYYSTAFGYYNLKTGKEMLKVQGFWNVIGIWDKELVLCAPKRANEPIVKREWGYEIPQFLSWTNDRKGNFYTAYIQPLKIHKKTCFQEELMTKTQIRNSKRYSPRVFKSLAFDEEKDELYAGSLIGLFRIRKGNISKCKLPGNFNRVRITDMEYHRKWGIIATTKGKGIFFFKNEQFVSSISEKDGLISNQLNALYVDKATGTIYAVSNKGISKIVPTENHRFRISNLTELNGLVSAEIGAVYGNKEGVYVGTRRGIALIPASYKWESSSNKYQISIESVFTNGKKVTGFESGMKFNSSHKVIRFLLKTTNYKSRHKQPYRYRFRKTDPWSVGFNGELILINPAFETYDLEIQYQNEYGSWSQAYSLTRFSVLPPFYMTWWFLLLMMLVVVLISFFFFRNRLQAVQRRNDIRRNMETLEQKALLAQMNPHFIFNSLNSIQSFLLYDENELAERYLLKLSKLIRLTLVNSRETEITLEKEIESLKMYLELEQMRFKNRFDFQFEIALSNQDIQRFIPPMLIQPFVENSIIHGFKKLKEGGMITLSFRDITDGILSVEVMDNGVGYENTLEKTDREHKSYGTKITLERLDLFKQKYRGEFSYTISSIYDSERRAVGTIVKMTIPVI